MFIILTQKQKNESPYRLSLTDRLNLFKLIIQSIKLYPADIYLLKVNYRNNKIRCEICSKLTIKPKLTKNNDARRHPGVFIVNLKHISHLVLLFL